jgi:peptidyl-prolyl cis-trans isomerase SurA
VKRRRILAVTAIALALPAVLTACNPGQAGAAALVGDSRLAESTVQSDTKDTITAMGPEAAANVDNATIMQNTVSRWVRHELLDQVAAEQGIFVTDGEVDALIASSLSQGTRKDLEQAAAQQASVPPAELDQYAHDVLLERKLGEALAPGGSTDQQQAAILASYQKVAKDENVSVSPRYGTFDEVALRMTPARNDLSIPLASQVATGQPSTSPSPSPSPSASS